MKIWGLFLSLCLLPAIAHSISLYDSQKFQLGLSGHYKQLFFTSKSQTTDRQTIADLNRVRTEWDARAFRVISSKITWDNEVIGGNFVNTTEFATRQTARNNPYLDLDYSLIHKKHFFYGQNLYRAYLKLDPSFLTLIAGRQRIDWGATRLFSPGDLFTPFTTFGVEPEEQVGTDALFLSAPLTPKLKISTAYAINNTFDRSSTGGRLTATLGRFDLSLFGGRFRKDGVLGFDFSGDVGGAGLRGEAVYFLTDVGKNFVQGTIGVDFAWPNSFYILGEYFFNGQGTISPLTSNSIKTARQHFMAVQMKYDLTPLWILSLVNVWDLEGTSLFSRPELKYSPISWCDLSTGLLIPIGKTGGEFTPVPNLYFLQTQLFF